MTKLIKSDNRYKFHLILLVIWLLIGTILRFIHLGSKPPWADEWATLVFSLGNSFLTIPVEKVISIDVLIEPLQLRDSIFVGDVINNLLKESTHPPIYFVLTHLWLKILSFKSGLVSIELARSLSVIFGILAIPTIFLVSYLITNSLVCSQLTAALMTFSPYGIYLAQETRHYTLAILLIMASLTCLIIAIKSIQQQKKLRSLTIFSWIIINSLGVATHYFFALALVTEILVLTSYFLVNIKNKLFSLKKSSPWYGISLAIVGTMIGCSVWLWAWLNIPDNQLTDWTKQVYPSLINTIFEPLGRIIAWVTTMVVLLPVEGTPLWVTIVSVLIVISCLISLIVFAVQFWQTTPKSLVKQVIGNYLIFAFFLILGFAYFGDRDLTLAARFQFFYFPCVVILVATILDYCWQQQTTITKSFVLIILLVSFLGSLTVINNYGYQKPDRPDLVVPVIRDAQKKNTHIPILITTVHKTHEQTGEMMGIAWEWLKQMKSEISQPKFLLLHKTQDTPEQIVTQKLSQQLAMLPHPIDVWVVNFSAPTGLEKQNCLVDLDYKKRVSGYRFRLFHCQ